MGFVPTMRVLSEIILLSCVIAFGWFVIYYPNVTLAQSLSSFNEERLGAEIELSPQFPRPGDKVVAKLRQYLYDSNYLLVTWKLNGQVVVQDFEKDSYTFTAGPVGSLVVLDVVIQDKTGKTAKAKKVFRINDISYLWEARSYTPPFFSGRPKFSYGTNVAVVVYPTIYSLDGRQYETSELLFKWFSSAAELGSGIGMNSIEVKPSTPFDALSSTVRIFDPTGEERMHYLVKVAPSPPRLVFYEDDPLLGILYRSAISKTFDFTKEELKLVAEPLYMGAAVRSDSSLSYSWNVGGAEYNFPGSVVLRPEGALSGTTDVSLTVINAESLLGRVQERISVRYGGSNSGYLWTDQETESL